MLKPLPNIGKTDEMHALLQAWEGKRTPIVLNTDQAIKAAFIAAAKRPCYLCGGRPETVWRKQLPERFGKWGGMFFFYGLCQPCHQDPNREAVVMKLLEFDQASEAEHLEVARADFLNKARTEVMGRVIGG